MGISTLITATDATSNVDWIDFTSGIDSTYDEYMFVLINVRNTADDEVDICFQVNATDGADYNDSLITSTSWQIGKSEAGSAALSYMTGHDLAQSTSFQNLANDSSGGSVSTDDCYDGIMHLFSPASTTYVKHFYSRTLTSGYMRDCFVAGYINDTTAIDNIRFKMNNGSSFVGSIHMYGIS